MPTSRAARFGLIQALDANTRCVVALNEIKDFLLWCVGLNYAVLLIWLLVFMLAHDWMFD